MIGITSFNEPCSGHGRLLCVTRYDGRVIIIFFSFKYTTSPIVLSILDGVIAGIRLTNGTVFNTGDLGSEFSLNYFIEFVQVHLSAAEVSHNKSGLIFDTSLRNDRIEVTESPKTIQLITHLLFTDTCVL